MTDRRLARLPPNLALAWPGGQAGCGTVRLTLHSRKLLAGLLHGDVGSLAEAYVRGNLDIDGPLADVMAVAAELADDPMGWMACAAIGWLLAFAPWVARLGRIYLSPRTDGKPG